MDFLHFQSVSLYSDSSIGYLCENLNNAIGHVIWYDTYQVQNTDMLWFVNEIIEAISNDNMLCGSFGLYPRYVAGILNRIPNIHLYVVCSEKINFEDYIRKCMANKECTISNVDDTFWIYFQARVIKVSVEQRVVSRKLQSELTFAYNILRKIRLSSSAYGIVSVKKRVTYITNEVLTWRHNCLPDLYAHDLHAPNAFANCKDYPIYCKEHPYKKFPVGRLFCSKRSHRLYCDPRNPCHCKLYIKTGPPSLTSLCVNRIASCTFPLF
jgi:hypothetical protein